MSNWSAFVSYFAKTRILQVNPNQPDDENIQIAAHIIRDGGLVAFPTETVYGLGANALDGDALDRIYQAKERPASDPIIAHIAHIDQLHQLAIHVPLHLVTPLAERFWPGALTLVLHRAPHVPPNIATGLNTIAVRMPAHPIARALIIASGVPIAAPSANTFTRPSATTAQHVLEDLQDRVDVVLDGGETTIGLESTVLDLTNPQTPMILRPGGVLLDELRAILPNVQLAPRYLKTDEVTSSPGQMLKHYSPRAKIKLFAGPLYSMLLAMKETAQLHINKGEKVGLLIANEDCHHLASCGIIQPLGKRDDLKTISHNLFAGMRYLDSQKVDVILTRDFGRSGLGAALWDRLLRAAEGRVIDVQ
ncbi:MAG: threonylcarbamoyl-AMP synthase [Phototrophicales bacterium]|nr:MAG: threonylcarbamoyl-AMP synthase [Phototrophicales bacterium]